MPVNLDIPSLGNKFQDYRDPIPGDSYDWGPVIDPQRIIYFTFHHSVTPQTAKNDGNWQAECNLIANIHLNNGWAGVGYRFIICSDGTVAYVGDLSHGGSAVAGRNDQMFSAVMVGNFTVEQPTDAQIESAHKLASHFLFNMPAYPNINDWEDIKGHKEFNPTACPGTNWKDGSNSLYEKIKNFQEETEIPQTGGGLSDKQILDEIKKLVWSSASVWTKVNKIKELLPK